ncbi:putative N-acetyltransferase [Cercospora beticola]|uniref:N-alpha-acetyltransferase 40 n=1 Tax=Cercospora beticola TaxID=122368 RepID=A0A2G5IB70_CERBT|nr:putative N-acetyltransferase [Cercospora beticola]PIB01942.1 putative N-acetyltransferase [Cercospora beticola]WPA96967.1 hypothetical protein RHO25_001575 [Cercospora beticola]CAK1354644.1 unnamed protein product [Cercospora beticola]
MGKRKSADEVENEPSSGQIASRGHGIIEAVNKLSEQDFKAAYLAEEDWSQLANVDSKFHFAKTLSQDELQKCFDLIERTSRHDYEPSSFGWHPKRKMREMKEKEMKYIIFKDCPPQDSSEAGISGFLSFMLTHDSTPSVPVLYIYEIHLDNGTRGKGLGRSLMKMAENIAKRVGVEKVMLTCFKSNVKARAFYEYLGYEMDICSPEDRKTRNKVVKVDYVIMSKDLTSPDIRDNEDSD